MRLLPPTRPGPHPPYLYVTLSMCCYTLSELHAPCSRILTGGFEQVIPLLSWSLDQCVADLDSYAIIAEVLQRHTPQVLNDPIRTRFLQLLNPVCSG